MAEGRWIDREKIAKLQMRVVDANADELDRAMVRGWNEAIEKIVEDLDGKTLQTVDRVGRWEISSDGYYPYCSACHYEPPIGKRLTKYCPECGAMMAGSEENRKETKESE